MVTLSGGRDLADVRRVIAFVRTDVSGTGCATDVDSIRAACAAAGYKLACVVESNPAHDAAPIMRVLDARDRERAHAVIAPGPDHFGDRIGAVSAVAFVLTLAPRAVWHRGERIAEDWG